MSGRLTIKDTYDFKCPCSYEIHLPDQKAKLRLQRLHTSKCQTYKTLLENGQLTTKTPFVYTKSNNGGKTSHVKTNYDAPSWDWVGALPTALVAKIKN